MPLPFHPNNATMEGSSLIRALDTQNVQLALYYIDRNEGLNGRDEHGNTALHLAVLYGFQRIACKLVTLGADLLMINDDMETPLHIAVRRGHFCMTKYLLHCGGYNDFTNVWGDTPAASALGHHHHSILSHIMKYATHNGVGSNGVER
jgi:uncharacterized protein